MTTESMMVGILHPGKMGVSVGASAKNGGSAVYWASEGRSQSTLSRATASGMVDVGTLERLCECCQVIIAVCPPNSAEAVADQVLECGYLGTYLDANAISPETVRRIGGKMEARGVAFVDGGIIGGPAWEPGTTRLYLSGGRAQRVSDLFSGGPLGTAVISDDIGRASALKMCYAATTKGTTALLCAVLAAAEQLQVRDELEWQWAQEGASLARDAVPRVRGVTEKAWRFAGEMDEIAATMRAVGLPGGFHEAAAVLYSRIAGFKDSAVLPEIDQVLRALAAGTGEDRA